MIETLARVRVGDSKTRSTLPRRRPRSSHPRRFLGLGAQTRNRQLRYPAPAPRPTSPRSPRGGAGVLLLRPVVGRAAGDGAPLEGQPLATQFELCWERRLPDCAADRGEMGGRCADCDRLERPCPQYRRHANADDQDLQRQTHPPVVAKAIPPRPHDQRVVLVSDGRQESAGCRHCDAH